MPKLSQLLPIAGWLPRYSLGDLKPDIQAGLTVAVMIIPQAIAYGLLAGVPPSVALYASIVPMTLYALLGTCRELSVGPAALISLMTAETIQRLRPDAVEEGALWITLAVLIALMVGVVQLALGLLRLGVLVNFLSRPVVSGFMSAAALIIAASQLGLLAGISLPHGHFPEVVSAAARGLPEAHGLTLAVGLGCVLLLALARRFAPKAPAPLLLVVLSTALTWALGLDERGLAVVGAFEGGLPLPHLPELPSAELLLELLPYAITIALVGFMESISVAKTYGFQRRYDVDADTELRAIGVANLAGALFGGMVVTGNISRTVVAAEAGVRSQLAALVTATVVLLTVVLLAPLFTFLPKAMLAAMIIVAVVGIVDVREPLRLARFKLSDAVSLAVTFFATLILGVEVGILAGVSFSVVALLHYSAFPHTAVLGRLPGTQHYRDVERFPDAIIHEEVVALRISESLFFANAPTLRDAVEHASNLHPHPPAGVVIDFSAVNDLDATALAVLRQIADELHDAGTQLALADVSGPVHDILEASGVLAHIGEAHIHLAVHEAVESFRGGVIERGLTWEATEEVQLSDLAHLTR